MKPYQHVVLGSGPLGLSVVRELIARKESVRLVNRSGRAPVSDDVDLVKADLYDPNQVYDVVNGARVVYMCAAPRYSEWVEKFPSLMHSVINGTSRANARLVFGDNLYAYGEVDGPIHENLPYAAQTRKGRVRAQISTDLVLANSSGSLEVSIGRGSDFFGPHALNSTLGERVFVPLLKGQTASALGNIDLPHTYTYIDDFGKALVVLGEKPEAVGRVFHVPNSATLSTRAILEKAFQLAGMPVKISRMGKIMMSIGGLFIPEARESVEMMYEFDKPFIVDSSLFTRVFGLQATPLEIALQKTIDWFRDIPE